MHLAGIVAWNSKLTLQKVSICQNSTNCLEFTQNFPVIVCNSRISNRHQKPSRQIARYCKVININDKSCHPFAFAAFPLAKKGYFISLEANKKKRFFPYEHNPNWQTTSIKTRVVRESSKRKTIYLHSHTQIAQRQAHHQGWNAMIHQSITNRLLAAMYHLRVPAMWWVWFGFDFLTPSHHHFAILHADDLKHRLSDSKVIRIEGWRLPLFWAVSHERVNVILHSHFRTLISELFSLRLRQIKHYREWDLEAYFALISEWIPTKWKSLWLE